jgi:hypothetical protein
MTNSEIERAVARATGESRSVISRYGFSLVPDECELQTDVSLAVDCPGCGVRLDVAGPLTEFECGRCDAVYPFAVDELYVANCTSQPLAACA